TPRGPRQDRFSPSRSCCGRRPCRCCTWRGSTSRCGSCRLPSLVPLVPPERPGDLTEEARRDVLSLQVNGEGLVHRPACAVPDEPLVPRTHPAEGLPVSRHQPGGVADVGPALGPRE